MDPDLLGRLVRRVEEIERQLATLKTELAAAGAGERTLNEVWAALGVAALSRAEAGRSTRINAVKGAAEKALGGRIRPEAYGFERFLDLLRAGADGGHFRIDQRDGHWAFGVELEGEDNELAILEGIRTAAQELIADGRNTQVPSIIGTLERKGLPHRPRGWSGRYVDFLRRGVSLGLFELRQNASGHWVVLVEGAGGGPDTVAAIKALRGKDLDELLALKDAADYDYDYDYDESK